MTNYYPHIDQDKWTTTKQNLEYDMKFTLTTYRKYRLSLLVYVFCDPIENHKELYGVYE